MTTFHTPRETDGVPAPSPFDPVHRPRGLDFNGATRALDIRWDRDRFYRWCGSNVNMSKVHDEDMWQLYYDSFVSWEDARDEYNERNHIDDRDERMDPHLDAFV